MLEICPSCNGVIGRDCWNPGECAEITADIERQFCLASDEERILQHCFIDPKTGQWQFKLGEGPYELIAALSTAVSPTNPAEVHEPTLPAQGLCTSVPESSLRCAPDSPAPSAEER